VQNRLKSGYLLKCCSSESRLTSEVVAKWCIILPSISSTNRQLDWRCRLQTYHCPSSGWHEVFILHSPS